MFNIQKILIDHFVKELESSYLEFFGKLESQNRSIISWFGHLALENISNTDALYHNIDHTIMVTMVGQELLKGKHLSDGGITPKNWLNFIIALLCHDIGYVKGICKEDKGEYCATGIGGKTININNGGTDASLTLYHVDRAKLFLHERFSGNTLINIDIEIICSYIELTRFPVPKDNFYQDTKGFSGLVRAADLIGQLGDPGYLRKLPALFYEFHENGMNEKIGYFNPGDLRKGYAKFYWEVIRPFIQDALKYLCVTQEGKQWIANLHSHVFELEHAKEKNNLHIYNNYIGLQEPNAASC